MFQAALIKPWICPRCVQRQSQRFLRTRPVREPGNIQSLDAKSRSHTSKPLLRIKRVPSRSESNADTPAQDAAAPEDGILIRRLEGHSEVPFSIFRNRSRRQLYEQKLPGREAQGIRVRKLKSSSEPSESQTRAFYRSRCRRSRPRFSVHRPLKAQHPKSQLVRTQFDFARPLTSQSSRARKIHAVGTPRYDDKELRQIFDSPSFWREFSESIPHGSKDQKVGLFQNRFLTHPRGFKSFTNTTLEKATKLVGTVIAASTRRDYIQIVRDLDRLSDLLCRVIDLADFVRSTHPSPAMQQAATNSWAKMYEYMNVLNTTTALHDQLKVAMQDEAITKQWNEEERMVARILERDFAKSAVELPEERKQRFVELSQEIGEVGTDFVDTMAPETSELSFRPSRLAGMNPMQVRNLTRLTIARIPTSSSTASDAVRYVDDEHVRKEVYKASRTASTETIQKLETLLKKRAQLAQVSKYPSWGHLTLSDKMAKDPQSVRKFLVALARDNGPNVDSELGKLAEFKATTPSEDESITSWDREYYTAKYLSSVRSKARSPDFISAYFSLGTVMQGLSRLFSQLYGIRFEPRPTTSDEIWNSDVRRLDVISATEGHVAVLYCDLFARAGKSPNPAHFTLRCSREIRKDELKEAESNLSPIFSNPIEAANDGMAVSKPTKSGSVYQLPTIALICDFSRSNTHPDHPTLLSFSEYETLFHEMGHAIHSIIGRTSLQNVSGTRCATDFCELPSILMEHFATDRSVVSLFARHYETDAPLPHTLLKEQLAQDKHFSAIEAEIQIFLSKLDQEYHSTLPLSPWFSSTTTYHSIQKQGRCPPDPPGTRWQGFFGHLFGYGATYYSYLFDSVIARRIWEKVFDGGRQKGALRRRNGDLYAKTILKWGGGRDPWRCLGDALGGLDGFILRQGGTRAMSLVGSWGFKEGKQVERVKTMTMGLWQRQKVGMVKRGKRPERRGRKGLEFSSSDWGVRKREGS